MIHQSRTFSFFIFGAIFLAAIIYRSGLVGSLISAKVSAAPLRVKIIASIPYWDQARAFTSFQQHVDQIDLVSVYWYYLGPDGGLTVYQDAENPDIITFAHQHGVKVFGLITNLPAQSGTTWDRFRVDRVIATPAGRKRHIDELMALVQRLGYDGLNIDYETLRSSQTKNFRIFIGELADALHRQHKLLKVAVESRSSVISSSHGKDWLAISRAADQLSIMTFEEHWDTSQPGPVASLPWVTKVLKFARRLGVPANKLVMGVPLDGYDWPRRANGSYSTADGVQYDEVKRLQQLHQSPVQYSSTVASPHFTYTTNGVQHQVWYENNRSFSAKLALAQKTGLAGITLWRLGAEDQRIWSILSTFNRK